MTAFRPVLFILALAAIAAVQLVCFVLMLLGIAVVAVAVGISGLIIAAHEISRAAGMRLQRFKKSLTVIRIDRMTVPGPWDRDPVVFAKGVIEALKREGRP